MILSTGDICITPFVIEIFPYEKNSLPYDSLTSIWQQVVIALKLQREITFILKIPSESTQRVSCITSIKQISLVNQGVRFTSLLRIIKLLKCNLETNTITTIRDIYYQDVHLFQKKQNIVKNLINSIAHSLNTTPEGGLSVVPSQKGLVYGDFVLQRPSSIHQSVNSYSCETREFDFKEPSLIPLLFDFKFDSYKVISGNVRAIIILEKEAVFRSICDTLQSPRFRNHGLIVVTGKGYPCKLTKKFISLLAYLFPKIPMLTFVDSDIYGIQICANYRYESTQIVTNVNWEEGGTLACDRIIFAGIFLLEYEAGWLDVNINEWNLMQKFLKDRSKFNISDSIIEKKFHQEVTRSMILHKKCEMNSMHERYIDYILNRVSRELRINKRSINDHTEKKVLKV